MTDERPTDAEPSAVEDHERDAESSVVEEVAQQPSRNPEGQPEGAAGDGGFETGASAPSSTTGGETVEPAPDVQTKIDELTGDLQRLQAEYVNYKRRVDRDRELTAQNATYKVLSPIIEVLDTIDRAREHGEVEGGFKAVADQLERIVTGLGLSKFGEPGEPFDPQVHEALSHLGTDPDVGVTTVKLVAKAGYRIGDRVVRAAQVLVVDPE